MARNLGHRYQAIMGNHGLRTAGRIFVARLAASDPMRARMGETDAITSTSPSCSRRVRNLVLQ
jgi:hypothetical protein